MNNRRFVHRLVITVVVAVALGVGVCSRGLIAQSAAPVDTRHEIAVSKNVMVTMRDGVRLATDIYRPAVNGLPAPGKLPVILERTPYNKNGIESWARYFVPRGYVAVGQDVRGYAPAFCAQRRAGVSDPASRPRH